MDEGRIKHWATSIGKNTAEVFDRIFCSENIKEQGYNSAISVLYLAKIYSEERLETACGIVLASIRISRYHHLKAILSGNQDKIYFAGKEESKNCQRNSSVREYVRGDAYYRGYDDKR